jgi:hypothetical protein
MFPIENGTRIIQARINFHIIIRAGLFLLNIERQERQLDIPALLSFNSPLTISAIVINIIAEFGMRIDMLDFIGGS